MDALDWILLAVVALGAWNGYRTGFVRQITRLFGAVIAYAVSLWLRPHLSPIIEKMHILPEHSQGMVGTVLGNFSGAVAFTLVFIVTFFLLRYAAGLIDALFSLPVLSSFNRLVGLVAGVLLAIIFVYVGTAILHYINDPKLQVQLAHSVIVQWLNGQQFHTIVHRSIS